MALPRGLVSGQGLTWVGPTLDDEAGLLVRPGKRGVFLDYDGHRPGDGYVVESPAVASSAAGGPTSSRTLARRYRSTGLTAARSTGREVRGRSRAHA